MASVEMDTRGRLVSLSVIPPERDEAPPADSPGKVDWASLFADAGLDIPIFTAATPQWTGLGYADSRHAWTGPNPEDPSSELRVEGAAYRGRPVFFDVITPWTRPERMVLAEGDGPDASQVVGVPIVLLVLGTGIFLAHRNLRLGRGDRKGALRFGLFVWTIMMLSWLLTASHIPDVGDEFSLLFRMAANALLAATLYAAFYLALEPYVRRLWPDRIISWSRVLRGGFRDPLVGRDILIGGVLFFVIASLRFGFLQALHWLDQPPGQPDLFDWDTLLGARYWLAGGLDTLQNSVFQPLFWFVLLLLLRSVFRREWIAFAVLIVTITVLAGLESSHLLLGMAQGFIISAGMLYVLTRFGLLPFMVAEFFTSLVMKFPLTLDASRWYFGGSLFALIVLVGLAIYGLATATAGQSLFRDELG
jgi:serine/threonine-protein kinase